MTLVELKGVLRLGFPALEKARGSPPSLRMTSETEKEEDEGRTKVKVKSGE
jgi:hypothetical protein